MSSYSPSELELILNSPGLDPPLGQKSNFNNPESISIYCIIVIGIGISLTALAVLMRCYTKRYLIKKFDWEDYVVILGWVMLVGYCVPNIYAARYGGAHQWNTRVRDLFSLLYYSNINDIMYGPTIFVVKLSILLQYLRVFVPSSVGRTPMFIGIHIVLWLNFLCYFIDTLLQIFACSPRALAWNKLLKGHCLPINTGMAFTATFNVVSDLAILLLPMYSIWRLQLPKKKKLGISALFAIGLLACVSSAARLVYSVRIITTKDVTWNLSAVGTWAIAEIAIGILCSCFPVLPKFVRNVSPKIYSITRSSFFGKSRQSNSATPPNSFGVRNMPTGTRGTREKNRIGVVDPYDSWNKLNDSEHHLEDWERTPNGEQHRVRITSPILKASDAGLANGRIVQTLSYDIEQNSRDGDKTAWRQV